MGSILKFTVVETEEREVGREVVAVVASSSGSLEQLELWNDSAGLSYTVSKDAIVGDEEMAIISCSEHEGCFLKVYKANCWVAGSLALAMGG